MPTDGPHDTTLDGKSSDEIVSEAVDEATSTINVPDITLASSTGSATGDGTATAFTVSNPTDLADPSVSVTPLTSAAAANHFVSNKTVDNIEITYTTAPADTAALEWDVVFTE